MKQIITAMGNPKINEELRKENHCNILAQDIQYQDGVIEILENNSSVEILILNSILPGDKSIEEFINKIQEINFKIEIIIIVEKENVNIKKFLISKGIFNVFYDNEITIKEITFLLKENKNKLPEEITEEIKLLKEMILNNNRRNFFRAKPKLITGDRQEGILRHKNIINKIINLIKIKILNKIINKNKKLNSKKLNKIISVVGAPGSGKTLVSYLLSNQINSKKILLIDFDYLNNNISTISGKNKFPKEIIKLIQKEKLNINKININNLIIKKNNNLDLICGLKLILKEKTDKYCVKNIINEVIYKYDLIIVDTPSDANNAILKQIMESSDKIVFLVIPNLLGIKASQKLLNLYVHNWKIEREKINILFNKNNINSINKLILNNLFSEFNILGKIKLNNKYDLLINNNKLIFNYKIKKEYLNILNKLNLINEEEKVNGF